MNKKIKVLLCVNFYLIISLFIMEVFFNKVLTNIDLYISNIIWSIRTPLLTDIFKIISFLASTKFIIAILIVYIFIKKDALFPLNMALSTILNTIIKKLVRRPRPTNILVREKSFSFPSGHTMASVSFYGYIIYLLYKSNYKIKKVLIPILIILILLIGFSRIYLGAHYLSDVITAYLISINYLIIFIHVTKKENYHILS